jgi:tripartite-type tricarboxylate transporter receptor subunit TctC
MQSRLALLAAVGSLLCTSPSAAQELQTRQIGIVVPFPADGSFEQFAELLKSGGTRSTRIARAANIRLD